MIRALLAGCLLGHLGTANAEDAPPTPARGFARSSTTIYLSNTWSPGPTVPIRIGVDGALRAHRGLLALEARAGAGGAGSVTGLGGFGSGHLGGSIGSAIPFGRRVVITPMLAYDVFAEWERDGASLAVHYVTLQLPVSIVLDRGVVLEPFLQAGVARYQGATDPVIVIGPRIGILL